MMKTNKFAATIGVVLLGGSLAFAGQNAAPPASTPQTNGATVPAPAAGTANAKTGTRHHTGKRHHKHHKHQKSQQTKP
jgi:hypothetical protein